MGPKQESYQHNGDDIEKFRRKSKLCFKLNLIFLLILFVLIVCQYLYYINSSDYPYDSDKLAVPVLLLLILLYPIILITSIIGIINFIKMYRIKKTGLAYLIYFIFTFFSPFILYWLIVYMLG